VNTLFHSDREFKVWRYLVSHGQLLLRSVPTSSEPKRIEVLFRNVIAMKTNTKLTGLTIRQPSEAEVLRIGRESGEGARMSVFIVESSCSEGYIVATDFATAEDGGDYKSPSSLLIGT
jgi:hypothetical protein